jgi:hypothetical protein
VLRLRSRFDALAVALAFAVAIAPIFPVATQYENRFAYVSWLCAAIVFASGTETVRNRRLAAAMMIGAPLLGVVVNRQAWKGEFNHAMRMSDEGRVFMDLGGGDFLRAPAIPPGTMFEVEWIKENLLHRAAGSRWFFDDLYLCSGERPRRVFGFDERSRTVREITADIPAIASRYCASIRPNEPLVAHFHYQKANGLLRWDLGPYDQGAYGVVVDNGFLSYDVKRRDVLQMTGMKLLSFRVRYRSPRGWATYSPELTLHFDRDQDLTWRR